jgi:uncharacterized membrane protein YcgQ (UPF0703/DUF1980 family)
MRDQLNSIYDDPREDYVMRVYEETPTEYEEDDWSTVEGELFGDC